MMYVKELLLTLVFCCEVINGNDLFDIGKGLYQKEVKFYSGKRCSLYIASHQLLYLHGCSLEDVGNSSANVVMDSHDYKLSHLDGISDGVVIRSPAELSQGAKFIFNDRGLRTEVELRGKIPKAAILKEFDKEGGTKHDLRSEKIVVKNSRQIYIPNLYYDGLAPAAHFWVGVGEKPNANGHTIPDENNSTSILKKYSGENITLTLDKETIYDIDYLAIWCLQFPPDFGYVKIPNDIIVPPYFPGIQKPEESTILSQNSSSAGQEGIHILIPLLSVALATSFLHLIYGMAS